MTRITLSHYELREKKNGRWVEPERLSKDAGEDFLKSPAALRKGFKLTPRYNRSK